MSLSPPRTITLTSRDGKQFKIICSNEKTTLTHPDCVEINELCLPGLGNINQLLLTLVQSVTEMQAILQLLPVEQLTRITEKMHVDDDGNLLIDQAVYVVPA